MRRCPLITHFEERGEPKRGVEYVSFRLPAERLTARPSRLTMKLEPGQIRFNDAGSVRMQEREKQLPNVGANNNQLYDIVTRIRRF